MAQYLIQDTTLTGIADAIRSKTGNASSIATQDMAAAILALDAGSGVSRDMEDALVCEGIAGNYKNDRVVAVRMNAFCYMTELLSAELPNVELGIGEGAFSGCTALQRVHIPHAIAAGGNVFFRCTSLTDVQLTCLQHLGENMFWKCTALKTIALPAATAAYGEEFCECTALETADFSALGNISDRMFMDCTSLTALILRGSSVPSLSATAPFLNTPIASGTGYIYVPSSMVNAYKADSGWSKYAGQIRALESYAVEEMMV